MQRRLRVKHIQSLKERLTEEARELRERAKRLSPGTEREDLLGRARHNDAAANMSEWLTSPGLKSPA